MMYKVVVYGGAMVVVANASLLGKAPSVFCQLWLSNPVQVRFNVQERAKNKK